MATFRCIRQSWGILFCWNTCVCCLGISSSSRRERTMDWVKCRRHCAVHSAVSHNIHNKLGEAGSHLSSFSYAEFHYQLHLDQFISIMHKTFRSLSFLVFCSNHKSVLKLQAFLARGRIFRNDMPAEN